MCQALLCPLHISSHLILIITQRDMFFYHSHVIAEETRSLERQHINHPLISHRATDVNLNLLSAIESCKESKPGLHFSLPGKPELGFLHRTVPRILSL